MLTTWGRTWRSFNVIWIHWVGLGGRCLEEHKDGYGLQLLAHKRRLSAGPARRAKARRAALKAGSITQWTRSKSWHLLTSHFPSDNQPTIRHQSEWVMEREGDTKKVCRRLVCADGGHLCWPLSWVNFHGAFLSKGQRLVKVRFSKRVFQCKKKVFDSWPIVNV